jgi:hypothetical protein
VKIQVFVGSPAPHCGSRTVVVNWVGSTSDVL